jgi:hypothetical protein
VRQQLRVDVQLADAAADQLGGLAAEVEDDDRVRLGGLVGRRAIVGRAFGSGGVEGGLQVSLDLGVIGGEDPMSGVGRLAMDRLAALSFDRSSLAQKCGLILVRKRRLSAVYRPAADPDVPPRDV